jgi:hypothetical protein
MRELANCWTGSSCLTTYYHDNQKKTSLIPETCLVNYIQYLPFYFLSYDNDNLVKIIFYCVEFFYDCAKRQNMYTMVLLTCRIIQG